MDPQNFLTTEFEADRTRLQAVAYRMLGSMSEADDAVQETWLRLRRSGESGIENLNGWLTAVVSHICLDMLRSRKSRREEPLEMPGREQAAPPEDRSNPEHEAILAESVGLALLVVLDTLAPAERIAFVLHDLFDVPFDQIGEVVGRSPEAARQLASRARRRVRGESVLLSVDHARQRDVVNAFLTAARSGDFRALLAVLDPDIVFQVHRAAGPVSRSKELRGAAAVAKIFSGRAQAGRAVWVNGAVGIVVAPLGRLQMAVVPTIAEGKIVRLDVIANPERLQALTLAVLSE